MQQVADWLEKLGLGQYAVRFAENGISIAALPHLTDQDLKDIGVLLGHRRITLAALGELAPVTTAAARSAAVEQRPQDTAERRQVTVMFCDLVGSTALSARMDPEDLCEVISAYQKCVAETVQRFGGFVAKYMGDGVLVYFGYPQAHEDDAERAVRAGEVVGRRVQLASGKHAITARGLVRYEAHNDALEWPQALKETLATEKPKVIVVMLGLNDRQTLRERIGRAPQKSITGQNETATAPSSAEPGQQGSGPAHSTATAPPAAAPAASDASRQVQTVSYDFHTDKWAEAYGKRIDEMIAALETNGVPVLWIGLPAIRPGDDSSRAFRRS